MARNGKKRRVPIERRKANLATALWALTLAAFIHELQCLETESLSSDELDAADEAYVDAWDAVPTYVTSSAQSVSLCLRAPEASSDDEGEESN
jgi:hypothetical protein